MKKGGHDGADDEITAKRHIHVRQSGRVSALQTASVVVSLVLGSAVIVGWLAVARNIPEDIAELREGRALDQERIKILEERQRTVLLYIERDQANASWTKERIDFCCPLYNPRRRQ